MERISKYHFWEYNKKLNFYKTQNNIAKPIYEFI